MKELSKYLDIRTAFSSTWQFIYASVKSLHHRLFGVKSDDSSNKTSSVAHYAFYLLAIWPCLMFVLSIPTVLDQLTSIVTLGFISCAYLFANAPKDGCFSSLNFTKKDQQLLSKAFAPSLLAWFGTGLTDHWIWHSPPVFGAYTPLAVFACSLALFTPILIIASLAGAHYYKLSFTRFSLYDSLCLRSPRTQGKQDQANLAFPIGVAAFPWLLRLLPLHRTSVVLRFFIKSLAVAAGIRTLANIPKLAPEAIKLPVYEQYKNNLNKPANRANSVSHYIADSVFNLLRV